MGVTSISGQGHLGRPQTLLPQEGLSLQRSECFGRDMAEALQLGVDLIATAYGGNTFFCTGPLAHPVRRGMCGGTGSQPCS